MRAPNQTFKGHFLVRTSGECDSWPTRLVLATAGLCLSFSLLTTTLQALVLDKLRMPWTSADWDWNVVTVPIGDASKVGTPAFRYLFYGRAKRFELIDDNIRSCLAAGKEPSARKSRERHDSINQTRSAHPNALEMSLSVSEKGSDVEHLRLLIVFLNLPRQARKEDLLQACSPAGTVQWTFIEHERNLGLLNSPENIIERQAQFCLRPCASLTEPSLARGYVCFDTAAGAQAILTDPSAFNQTALQRMVSFHLKHALPTPLRGALQTNCFFDWFWLRFQYDHPVDLEVLEEECNQVMAAHERQLRRTAREAQRKRNFVDDEGFTLVVPRTRRRQHPNHAYTLANHGLARPQSEVTEATHTKPAALASGKDPQTNGAHAGFYRFQREEEKRQKLAELQAKFERDKQRLRHLRAVRQPFLN